MFIEVILPIAIPKAISYHVPDELQPEVDIGKRVEVQLGSKKRYSGIISRLHPTIPSHIRTKAILAVLDREPILTPYQIDFWHWIAGYYCCTVGEVMQAALPSALKLSSETRVILHPDYKLDEMDLSDDEYLITEALTIEHELDLGKIREIVQKHNVHSVIQGLFFKGVIIVQETLKEKHKPKIIDLIDWHPDYLPYEDKVLEALEKVKRSEKQTRTLLALIQLANTQEYVTKTDLYRKAAIDSSILRALEKKGILIRTAVPAWQLRNKDTVFELPNQPLNPTQEVIFQQMLTSWESNNTLLLHGVTGSGKTHLYVHHILKHLRDRPEDQVLYLLPEIALTTQITSRLKKVFGDRLLVYHSGLSDRERIEVWRSVLDGHAIVLGARSAIFLPFQRLGMIIVDEEHDPSYKQVHPAPRYNARDAAIYLARLFNACVILGTATPSIESYFNAKSGKYGLIELQERHSGVELPEIKLIDLKKALKDKQIKNELAIPLIDKITENLDSGQQVLLFKNRRGYTPVVSCKLCGWTADCIRCDVSLTYHQYFDEMRCHYCGFREKLPRECPNCGHGDILLKGFGTERLEEVLKETFPDTSVGRLDFDTARSKRNRERIIEAFELGDYQILVGTQMISKGLDFDHIGLVGVIGADQILHRPDFRCHERAFQLITQVSGRAGRQKERGEVLIQVFNTRHPVLKYVLENDYLAFYENEIQERKEYKYPPFYRLITVSCLHKDRLKSLKASELIRDALLPKYHHRILGPTPGGIPRIRGKYIFNLLIKVERNATLLRKVKEDLTQLGIHIKKTSGLSAVRINIDVDPY